MYFKFKIEKGISYSPNWHGTMPHCPGDVTVLLYNDNEGYGIAQTDDILVSREIEVLKDREVQALLSSSINQLTADDTEKAIFFLGDFIPKDREFLRNTIEHRWDLPIIIAKSWEVLDG